MTLKELGLTVIATIAVFAAIYGYLHPVIKQVNGTDYYYPVPVPKPYAVITKETITVEKIKIITKTEIKEKWPAYFTGDPNQQMTAIGLIEPYKGKTECAAIINIVSGDTHIEAKRLPVPMFGFENTVRVGAIFGVGTEVHANWTFARVGSFYATAGISGIMNGSNSATAIGIGFDKEF